MKLVSKKLSALKLKFIVSNNRSEPLNKISPLKNCQSAKLKFIVLNNKLERSRKHSPLKYSQNVNNMNMKSTCWWMLSNNLR